MYESEGPSSTYELFEQFPCWGARLCKLCKEVEEPIPESSIEWYMEKQKVAEICIQGRDESPVLRSPFWICGIHSGHNSIMDIVLHVEKRSNCARVWTQILNIRPVMPFCILVSSKIAQISYPKLHY